ncbi:MAG: carbonic anhydrase [Ferrovibrionaceae bacterium]
MCELCPPATSSRRGMLKLAAGAAAAAGLFSLPAAAQAPNAISPDEALKRLMDGNARYVANAPQERDFSAGRAARATSQYPIAAVLSCADARVGAELAFDQSQGDIFSVRLAGNFVNDDGLASLEYATRFLGTPLVMVLGHSACGAVDAAIKVLQDNAKLPGHLPQLIRSIKPAVESAKRRKPANLLDEAIVENVRLNVHRLQQARPIITEKVRDGKIRIVGAIYEIATGRVQLV